MKYYCQFTRTQSIEYNDKMQAIACKPYQQDILGSDNVFILDGRNNIDTMIQACIEQWQCRKNIYKDITGFKIVQANNFRIEGTIIYNHIFQYAWSD